MFPPPPAMGGGTFDATHLHQSLSRGLSSAYNVPHPDPLMIDSILKPPHQKASKEPFLLSPIGNAPDAKMDIVIDE